MAELGVTYKHVSWSPETEDYLKTLGGSDELVKKVLASKPSITYLDAGDGKVRLVSKGEGREKSVTFKFGETYEDTGFDGNVSQNVSTRTGDHEMTTERTYASGMKTRIDSKVTGDDLVQTVTDLKSGKTAIVRYTKA